LGAYISLRTFHWPLGLYIAIFFILKYPRYLVRSNREFLIKLIIKKFLIKSDFVYNGSLEIEISPLRRKQENVFKSISDTILLFLLLFENRWILIIEKLFLTALELYLSIYYIDLISSSNCVSLFYFLTRMSLFLGKHLEKFSFSLFCW